jgi:hypothetical protein
MATTPGEVLVLALEDGERRLRDRLGKVLDALGVDECPTCLHYATDWPRAHEGGLDAIERWIGEHSPAALVVLSPPAWRRSPPGITSPCQDHQRGTGAPCHHQRGRRVLSPPARRPRMAALVRRHARTTSAAMP